MNHNAYGVVWHGGDSENCYACYVKKTTGETITLEEVERMVKSYGDGKNGKTIF